MGSIHLNTSLYNLTFAHNQDKNWCEGYAGWTVEIFPRFKHSNINVTPQKCAISTLHAPVGPRAFVSLQTPGSCLGGDKNVATVKGSTRPFMPMQVNWNWWSCTTTSLGMAVMLASKTLLMVLRRAVWCLWMRCIPLGLRNIGSRGISTFLVFRKLIQGLFPIRQKSLWLQGYNY